MICKKEWQQYFSSITGYIAIVIFLLVTGLFLFVFPESSLLNFGYASLQGFFDFAPWVLLFLVPTITMRSLAEEYKTGTFELLKTLPLSNNNIIGGKFFGAVLIVLVALLPTVVYAFSMQYLSNTGGIDIGATFGSYIGLILLCAAFAAVGMYSSSLTNNTVVAFIVGAFICFLLFTGFDAISKLSMFKGGVDYYIEMLGINFHYKSLSRGVIEIRDIIYFAAVIFSFLVAARKRLMNW